LILHLTGLPPFPIADVSDAVIDRAGGGGGLRALPAGPADAGGGPAIAMPDAVEMVDLVARVWVQGCPGGVGGGGGGVCRGGGPSFLMELGAPPDTPQRNPENVLNPQTPVATPRNPEEHIKWEAPTSCAPLGFLLNWESAGSGFSLGSSVACPGPKRNTEGPPLHPFPPHPSHSTHPPTHVKKQHPGGSHGHACGSSSGGNASRL